MKRSTINPELIVCRLEFIKMNILKYFEYRKINYR